MDKGLEAALRLQELAQITLRAVERARDEDASYRLGMALGGLRVIAESQPIKSMQIIKDSSEGGGAA